MRWGSSEWRPNNRKGRTTSVILQRAADKKREQEAYDHALIECRLGDPRLEGPLSGGRVKPLIEEDNG